MDGRRGVPRGNMPDDVSRDVSDVVSERRERLRRWGWVGVGLGLPGLGIIGYATYLLLAEGGHDLGAFYVVGTLLALPAAYGARMIARGWFGDSRDVQSAGSVGRQVGGWVGLLVLTGGVLLLSVPVCGCSTRVGAYGAAMKSDLKNLASQQEIYFSDNRTYSASARDLAFVNSDGAIIDVWASQHGWTARAWHRGLGPEIGCALWWGDSPGVMSTAGGQMPINPGELVCDELP